MNPEEVLREYEQCRNQAEILQQNLNLIDSNLGELMIVKKSLDELKDAKNGSEAFVPIGQDSFVKAKITDTKNVVVGVGAGIAVKKTIEEAKEDIEKRITELEKVKKDNASNFEQLVSKLRELEPSVQSIMAQPGQKEG